MFGIFSLSLLLYLQCFSQYVLQPSTVISSQTQEPTENLNYLIQRGRLLYCPIGWGCRIHWLHLCRGVRPPPNECPGYDTKQSDGEVPAMLELWGMQTECSPTYMHCFFKISYPPVIFPVKYFNLIQQVWLVSWLFCFMAYQHFSGHLHWINK